MEKASVRMIGDRIYHIKGTAREIGVSMGHALGSRLEQNISLYMPKRSSTTDSLDWDKLMSGALSWMRSLPVRFQHEFEGLVEGAHLPLQHIAE